MNSSSRSHILWLLLVGASSGCASTMSLSSFEATSGVSWPELHPGRRVLVHAGPTCDLRGGASLEAALRAGKEAIHLADGDAAIGEVGGSRVDPSAHRVAFELKGDGRTDFVSMPFGGKGCLYPAELAGYEEAKAASGKRFVFAPWKLACDTVLAVGQSASSILFEGEGAEVSATGVRVIPDSRGAPMPWVTFSAKFAVPMQTLDACFEVADSELAKPPADLRRLLHLEDKQCASSDHRGKPHLACTSSLGVWQIESDDTGVKATLRHQTLGTTHFLGPRLMDGEAFAKVVVGLELVQATDERQRAVVAAMTEAVRAALAREAGGARVTTKEDPAATVHLRLSLADLTVGALQTSEERETVTYRDLEVDVPNPNKAVREAAAQAATAAVPEAEQALKDAESRFEESKQARERVAQECRDQAKKLGTWGGLVGGAGCGAATDAAADLLLVSNARSKLQRAKADAVSTRAAASAEPATTRQWVVLPWTYTKKAYRRSVSVNVDLIVAPRGGEPARTTDALRLDLSDWEVAADERHGVKGHSPDRNLVDHPDSLGDRIAAQVSQHVQAKLRAALLAEERRTAADALAKAGIEVTREDNVVVDSLAFAAVGTRIVKAERRGTAKAASSSLLVDGIELSRDECLLAVAAAVEPVDAPLVLWAKDRRVIDDRRRSSAFVELCGPAKPFTLELPRGGAARWAVYRVK